MLDKIANDFDFHLHNIESTHIGIVECIVVAVVARGSVLVAARRLGWRLSDVIISAGGQLRRHLWLLLLLLMILMRTWRLHQQHLLIRTRHVMIIGMVRRLQLICLIGHHVGLGCRLLMLPLVSGRLRVADESHLMILQVVKLIQLVVMHDGNVELFVTERWRVERLRNGKF